jgi:hypothetical protein
MVFDCCNLFQRNIKRHLGRKKIKIIYLYRWNYPYCLRPAVLQKSLFAPKGGGLIGSLHIIQNTL